MKEFKQRTYTNREQTFSDDLRIEVHTTRGEHYDNQDAERSANYDVNDGHIRGQFSIKLIEGVAFLCVTITRFTHIYTYIYITVIYNTYTCIHVYDFLRGSFVSAIYIVFNIYIYVVSIINKIIVN